MATRLPQPRLLHNQRQKALCLIMPDCPSWRNRPGVWRGMSHNGIHVGLIRRPKSGIWVIRFRNPETGKVVQQSTGTKDKREAERQAGSLRADLFHNRYEPLQNISWDAARMRYETEHCPSLARKTRLKIATTLNAVERELTPAKLRDLTADQLSKLQAELRRRNLSESSISSYLAHLRAFLGWAVGLGLLHRVPRIQKPKRAKTSNVMKGRPITDAEFQLMIAATSTVVGENAAKSWEHLLRGLYFSGLRLGESLEMSWDDPRKLCIVFEDDVMLLRVPAELEKGHKDRLMPLAPEFVDFLLQTPNELRQGLVFKPQAKKVHGPTLTVDRVTRIIAAIGEKAGIIVNTDKFASAHDLRRSFGQRWATRVMPQVLMELMRHESIETTLKFYVGRNAIRTSKVLREAYNEHVRRISDNNGRSASDTSGDTPLKNSQNDSLHQS